MIAALTGFVMVAMVGACAPEQSSDGSGVQWSTAFNLNVQLVADGFDLSWNHTPVGAAAGYELQVRELKPMVGEWIDIDGPGAGEEPTAHFSDVTEEATYQFRVRETSGSEQNTNQWSRTVDAWFVVPLLPIVRVDTDGYVPVITKGTKLRMTASLDPNGSGHAAVSGVGEIKGRGNSTWTKPKKPYQIKFDSKTSMMGMPKAKKWILLANYLDRSQLRTYAAAEISKLTSLEWTPGYEWVELILNGQYMGVYQLAEKIEVASKRVNIDEMSDNDTEGDALTGGYLLQYEGRLAEKGKPGWYIADNLSIAVEDPEPATPEQFSYIKDYVNTFNSVLRSSQFKNPDTGYAQYLDVSTFIDYWLIQEATKNIDAFWDSTYFYKKRSDPKLYFGPIWDHDATMGNPAQANTSPEGWASRKVNGWVTRLVEDPAFMATTSIHWAALSPQIADIAEDLLTVAPELDDALVNDRVRWEDFYGEERPSDSRQFLHDWLLERLAWLDARL